MMTEAQVLMKEMDPGAIDTGGFELKPCKKRLNANAVKFHLSQLSRATIRYEVIYKNLVREVRKYFVQELNSIVIDIRKPTDFYEAVKFYAETRIK